MNRRSFLQSVAAMISFSAMPALPALSVPSASAVVAVPNQARFWAIYMSTMQGQCTPKTLQATLNIPATEAKKYVAQLIADGVLKQNSIVSTSVANFAKGQKNNLLERIKQRFEMKSEARVIGVELEEEDSVEPIEIPQEEIQLEDSNRQIESENDSDAHNEIKPTSQTSI